MKRRQSPTPRPFADVPELEDRVAREAPPPGEYLFDFRLEAMRREFANMSERDLLQRMKLYFRNLPLSAETLRALAKRGFVKPTEVQRCVIPHALAGRDVLVSSKTGSGKTLAYVAPLVENLYRRRWTPLDGVGGLVLVPTRELAVQVFEVLRSLLGEFHRLSFGLVVGGKSLEAEQAQVAGMNLLVCTPGRLLQHLTETPGFGLDNLQMLVLDEADEILSQGFSATLTQILACVPRGAQTMLFSATLSRGVLGLSRVALRAPEQVFLRGDAGGEAFATPAGLTQYAMLVAHHDKTDVLFSFLKSHRFAKTVVFVSCCKQVRFLYEAFRRLRIGLPLFELHARQKQAKRTAVFFAFAEARAGALIATNLAARGLDFPKVDWIVQLDLPEDAATYVHRVGRTARFQDKGKALALVDPSERRFLDGLATRGLAVAQITPNPAKQLTIRRSLQVLCSEDAELKHLGQRAVISFAKSVAHMPNKRVFDLRRLDLPRFAESYGLVQTPVLEEEEASESDEEPESAAGEAEETPGDKQAAAGLSRNQRKLMRFKEKLREKRGLKGEVDPEAVTRNLNVQLNATRETQLVRRREAVAAKEEDAGELLTLRRREPPATAPDPADALPRLSKRQLKRVKPSGIYGGKNIFDIDAEANFVPQDSTKKDEFRRNLESAEAVGTDLTQVYASKLAQHQDLDKAEELGRVKEQRQRKKAAVREARADRRGGAGPET